MIPEAGRVLVHQRRDRRLPIDPEKVFLLEAAGGETRIRTRKSSPVIDIRPLGDVAPLFEKYGFLRVHRSHVVNLRRIQEIRMRASGDGWEIVLRPPVKNLVPVSRSELHNLWKAFGEE